MAEAHSNTTLLLQKTNKVEEKEAIEKLHKRYHSFAKRMKQTDSDELLEMFVTALTTGFDPHTTYMSPRTLENFQILMKLELDGIGAGLMQEDSYTTVTKIIPEAVRQTKTVGSSPRIVW